MPKGIAKNSVRTAGRRCRRRCDPRGEQAAGRSRCGCSDPVGSGAPPRTPESNKVVDFVDRGYPIPYGDTTATVLVGHFAAQHNGAVITCDSAIPLQRQAHRVLRQRTDQ